jgi:two-component system sensor histidine kinase QseC
MELSLDYSRPTPDEVLACFQAYVGHELLNHLVAAQGLARLVLEEEGERLGDEGRMMLGRLAALTRRADDMARRLADIGRLLREPAAGPPVAVGPLLSEAAAAAKALSRRDDIRYDIRPAGVSAPVSPRLLYAVLKELTDNASRAVPPGRAGVVALAAEAAPGGCLVSVSDDGHGLSDAQRSLLLEPFAAARQPGATGTGLGFFLVRQAARRWGGRVEVRSGPGTTVSLLIPAEVR